MSEINRSDSIITDTPYRPLYDPEEFTPNSANGQHILLDQEVLRTTAELIPTGAHAIEIGAGPGTLTTSLLERGGDVIAYEVDGRCEPMLTRLTTETNRLDVRWQNFLEAPKDDLEAKQPFHIVGNIPFQISEPLMVKLTDIKFASAVLLVGQNLVKAMTAQNPDSSSFSRLSLITGAYFDVEKVLGVPRESFDPPPRVNAVLVRMTRKDESASWRSDAVVRSYRALVEAQSNNSTVAKALKSVIVTPRGDAETGSTNRRASNRRSERRIANMALSSLARDYNSGASTHQGSTTAVTSLDMFSIISKTVDERLLSKPLSGLSNNELVKICSAITTAVNRRKKTR